MKLFIILILINLILINSQPNTFLESGVYVSVNSNFLSTYTESITTEVQSGINAYNIANIDGSDGSIKYQFTGIQQSVELSNIYYIQFNTPPYQYAVGWRNVTFKITCDFQLCYHILLDKDVEICEHGHVTINSQALISMYSNITLNFNSQSPATLKSTGSLMVVPNNGINYNVDCTSRVCDKTHDIRDKIASEFVPMVQTSITNGINEKSSEFTGYFPSLRKLNYTKNGFDFFLNSQGILVESTYQPTNPNTPSIVLDLQGGIVISNKGGYKYPTQTPTFKPSTSSLENFSTDVSVLITPYFVESMIDAALNTTLPLTITSKEVPSESPVTLNTSDPFFLQTAPGLEKYPNLPITVTIAHSVSPNVWINSTGITLNGTQLMAQFYIQDNKNTINIFTVNFILEIEIKLAVTQTGQNLNVTATLESLNPNADVVGSQVGSVDPSGFIQLLQLLQSFIKLPSFSITNPLADKYSISSLSLIYSTQYSQLTFNLNQKSQTKTNKHMKISHF